MVGQGTRWGGARHPTPVGHRATQAGARPEVLPLKTPLCYTYCISRRNFFGSKQLRTL